MGASGESMDVFEIHKFPQYMEDCCELINLEWPRSKTARMRTLEMSCDSLPTCLILVKKDKVIGHIKLSPIPAVPLGCFIESVVIHPDLRGKGYGKLLMTKSEDYIRSRGLHTAYLSTKGQEGFYSKLDYTECEPVSIYGGYVGQPSTKQFNHVQAVNHTSVSVPCSKTSLGPPPPPLPPPVKSSSTVEGIKSKKTYMKKDLI